MSSTTLTFCIIKTFSALCMSSLLMWLAFPSIEYRNVLFGSRQLNIPHADQLPMRDMSHNLWKLTKAIDNFSGEEIQNALPIHCFLHSYTDVDSTDTQAAIVTNEVDGFVAIMFRSTEKNDFNDWKTNFSSKPVSPEQLPGAGQEVKLHKGFQGAVISNNLAADLANEVMNLLGEDSLTLSKVYVTGMSLGGALAHIMGVYLAANYKDKEVNVVNFGAPRFGNDQFKTWTENSLSNLSVWRFVNRADAVPRSFPKFSHAGHLFQIWRKSSEMFYNQVGGGEYKGAPNSWHAGSNVNHHLQRKYNDFFEKKAYKSKFWPTSFSMITECKWWQFWC